MPNAKDVDEVLDGQQRLAAIRDFYGNKFPIDGNIEPKDEVIVALDGCYYENLSPEWQRRFKKYSINLIRLTEYKPAEPAELFYRLNQPSSLTSAEQRNAYLGITRDQIKSLAKGKTSKEDETYILTYENLQNTLPFFDIMLTVFNQRASVGSTDALAIIYRDITINLFKDAILGTKSELLGYATDTFLEKKNLNYVLDDIIAKYKWGEEYV